MFRAHRSSQAAERNYIKILKKKQRTNIEMNTFFKHKYVHALAKSVKSPKP